MLDAAAAAASFADLIAGFGDDGQPVLIAVDGEPRAALVSAADLADLRRLRRAERRRAALAELERLTAAVSASNEGFSDEEAEAIGKRLGKEINRAITERLRREADDQRRSAWPVVVRCLLDASVLLAYLASPAAERTAVYQILRATVAGTLTLIWPAEHAIEVERAASGRRSIRKRVGDNAASTMLAFLDTIGEPMPRLIGPYPPICRDPNDDYLVASALAGRADLVVTLDDDLLALGEYAGVRFVKPGGALAILREAGLLPPD